MSFKLFHALENEIELKQEQEGEENRERERGNDTEVTLDRSKVPLAPR